MHAGRERGEGLLLLLLFLRAAALYLLLLLLGEPATKCFSSFLVSLSLYIFLAFIFSSISSSSSSSSAPTLVFFPLLFGASACFPSSLVFFSLLGGGGGVGGCFSPYFPCLESLVFSFAIGLFLLLLHLLVFLPPW